jgi:hypothetical protein
LSSDPAAKDIDKVGTSALLPVSVVGDALAVTVAPASTEVTLFCSIVTVYVHTPATVKSTGDPDESIQYSDNPGRSLPMYMVARINAPSSLQ